MTAHTQPCLMTPHTQPVLAPPPKPLPPGARAPPPRPAPALGAVARKPTLNALKGPPCHKCARPIHASEMQKVWAECMHVRVD